MEYIFFKDEYNEVKLVTIKSNNMPRHNRHVNYLHSTEIMNPNTDYNCINIGKILLFMVKKNSIKEYKNTLIDRLPLHEVVDIKDKNIINFVHWALSQDISQCVHTGALSYVLITYYIKLNNNLRVSKSPIADKDLDSLADYLSLRLDESSFDTYDFPQHVACVGEAILENTNLKEQYQKCISENSDNNVLLKEIREATKRAFMSIDKEIYLVNTARAFLYNKMADMLYKDIEKIEKHYVINIYIRGRDQIKKLPLYSITDDRNTLINFLTLLLGHVIDIGIAPYIKIDNDNTIITKDACTYVFYPTMEYQIDCKNNKVSVSLKEIGLRINRDRFEVNIRYEWETTGIPSDFKSVKHATLFSVLSGIKAFLKQYHKISDILFVNNAIMVMPLVRLFGIHG